jgi:hypothetical protein
MFFILKNHAAKFYRNKIQIFHGSKEICFLVYSGFGLDRYTVYDNPIISWIRRDHMVVGFTTTCAISVYHY